MKLFLLTLIMLLSTCVLSQTSIEPEPYLKPETINVGYVEAYDPDGDQLIYFIANQEPKEDVFHIHKYSGLLFFYKKYFPIIQKYKKFTLKVCVSDAEFTTCAIVTVTYGNNNGTTANQKSTSIVEIKKAIDNNEIISIEIYNISGQLVTRKLSNLPKGIYICKIVTKQSTQILKLNNYQ